MSPQGGRAKEGAGWSALPDPPPPPPPPGAWPSLPTPTQTPPCRAAAVHPSLFAAAVTPTPCRRAGPGDAVSQPEGPDLAPTHPPPWARFLCWLGPKAVCEPGSQSCGKAEEHPPEGAD